MESDGNDLCNPKNTCCKAKTTAIHPKEVPHVGLPVQLPPTQLHERCGAVPHLLLLKTIHMATMLVLHHQQQHDMMMIMTTAPSCPCHHHSSSLPSLHHSSYAYPLLPPLLIITIATLPPLPPCPFIQVPLLTSPSFQPPPQPHKMRMRMS